MYSMNLKLNIMYSFNVYISESGFETDRKGPENMMME